MGNFTVNVLLEWHLRISTFWKTIKACKQGFCSGPSDSNFKTLVSSNICADIIKKERKAYCYHQAWWWSNSTKGLFRYCYCSVIPLSSFLVNEEDLSILPLLDNRNKVNFFSAHFVSKFTVINSSKFSYSKAQLYSHKGKQYLILENVDSNKTFVYDDISIPWYHAKKMSNRIWSRLKWFTILTYC